MRCAESPVAIINCCIHQHVTLLAVLDWVPASEEVRSNASLPPDRLASTQFPIQMLLFTIFPYLLSAMRCNEDPVAIENGHISTWPTDREPGTDTRHGCTWPHIPYESGLKITGTTFFHKVCTIDYDTFTTYWAGNYTCDGKS